MAAVLPLLLACMGAAVSAADLAITVCDGVARRGLPLRCRIERSDAVAPGRGPWQLQVGLEQDGRTLIGIDIPIEHLAQVRQGITTVLTVPDVPLDRELRLRAVLTSATRDLVEQASRMLPTPLSLAVAARGAAGRAGTAEPLPRLWAEQAAELALLPPSVHVCERITELTRRLDAWTAGRHAPAAAAGVIELACADAVDGSVQPCRLRLPEGDVVAVVVVCADQPAQAIKADWPAIDPAWASAARAAQVALLETYPAGDRAWSGIAPRRARLALATVRTAWPVLARVPAALLGVGQGATGALALAEDDPTAWRALALVTPRCGIPSPSADPIDLWLGLGQGGRRPGNAASLPVLCAGPLPAALEGWRLACEAAGGQVVNGLPAPAEAGFWRALATAAAQASRPPAAWTITVPGTYAGRAVPSLTVWGNAEVLHPGDAPRPAPRSGKRLGHACGPLAAYADGPFVVVQGTGEHAAAVEDNRRLAERFTAAWRAHAHGDPPLVRDGDFQAGDWPRHHLVLIGNPRSNRALARLVDVEVLPVRWDDRTVRSGSISLLRSARAPLALCWPHPADDGRLLVILDGAPAWEGDGLPLAGLPDLVLGPPERPLVRRLFGNDWR